MILVAEAFSKATDRLSLTGDQKERDEIFPSCSMALTFFKGTGFASVPKKKPVYAKESPDNSRDRAPLIVPFIFWLDGQAENILMLPPLRLISAASVSALVPSNPAPEANKVFM